VIPADVDGLARCRVDAVVDHVGMPAPILVVLDDGPLMVGEAYLPFPQVGMTN